MTQAIGYWLMSTVITAFIVTFDPDFNVKKVKMVAGFSVFIALLMTAVMLMLGGWK